MNADARTKPELVRQASQQRFPAHGRIGLLLVLAFWALNWGLHGLRTHWAFFPLWLGYVLLVDGLVLKRTGSSLLTRSAPRFIGLFAASAPAWWLFEAFNVRTLNWIYLGAGAFSPLAFAFLTTLSFTTVMPAVLEAAELMSSLGPVQRMRRGPRVGKDRRTTLAFFMAGWVSLALVLLWPRPFFPLVWISVYFIIEPLNVWMGTRSLADSTRDGDWRPVIALWLGVLCTAFFWEMWNYFSYPKWIYRIPWGDWCHLFEMPLLGYGGYLPFSLELFALYNLILALVGKADRGYVRLFCGPAARPLPGTQAGNSLRRD